MRATGIKNWIHYLMITLQYHQKSLQWMKSQTDSQIIVLLHFIYVVHPLNRTLFCFLHRLKVGGWDGMPMLITMTVFLDGPMTRGLEIHCVMRDILIGPQETAFLFIRVAIAVFALKK